MTMVDEHLRRILQGLPKSELKLASANLNLEAEVSCDHIAQLYLNLSYLLNPETIFHCGKLLWPPSSIAAPMLASPTVGQLLELVQSACASVLLYPWVLTSDGYFDIYLMDAEGYFYRHKQGKRIHRVAVELWVSALLQLLHWLGLGVSRMQLYLPWLDDASLPYYLSHWQLPVRKGGPFAVLRVRNAIWQQPLARANANVFAFAAKPEEPLLIQLRMLQHRQLDLTSCAEQLGMSSATLKRRLRDRKTSFRQQSRLLNAMNCDHQERFMGLDKNGLMQRFSLFDRSTFNRAYQRWFEDFEF